MSESMKTFLEMVQTVGFFGAVVGLLRLVIQRRYTSFAEAFAVIASSMLVAVIVGLALSSTSFPPPLQYAIVGLCSLISDEMLIIVASLARTAKDDPSKLIDAAKLILRGGKP